jgi:hypothetical protein
MGVARMHGRTLKVLDNIQRDDERDGDEVIVEDDKSEKGQGRMQRLA